MRGVASRAASAKSRNGPARSVKVSVPLAAGLGPEALEEVLVGVGGVELDELDRAVLGEVAGQLAGQVGLAGAGRAVEDDLLALPEQVGDLDSALPGP